MRGRKQDHIIAALASIHDAATAYYSRRKSPSTSRRLTSRAARPTARFPRLGNTQVAVRSLLILLTDVGSQDPRQMAPAEHQSPLKTLRTHLDRRLNVAFAFGAWTGGFAGPASLAAQRRCRGREELGVVDTPALVGVVHRGAFLEVKEYR